MMLDRLLADIQERNYAEVPFAIGRKELEAAAAAYLSFLSLPEEFKERFNFKLYPKNSASMVGYMERKRKGGIRDDKEYFHYHPAADEAFNVFRKEGGKTVEAFFDHARSIYGESTRIIRKILSELDGKFSGVFDKFFSPAYPLNFYLRFLKYNAKGSGDFLANGHYDSGHMTLAIAESAPGLRIGRDERSLREVVHKEKSVIFMPSFRFPEVTGKEFAPAWHDVIQKGGDRLSDDVSRWAIVFFADAFNSRYPGFKKTHTPKRVGERAS